MEKPKTPERPIPQLCESCQSLHKEYQTILCKARQMDFFKHQLLVNLPIIGRFVGPWECDLRSEEPESTK